MLLLSNHIDTVFGKTIFFNAIKMKTYLQLSIHRLQLSSNKKTELLKQSRREVALLLAQNPPQEDKARIRVESIVRDDNLIEVCNILQLQCELLLQRMRLIENSQSCPSDMVSCVCTIAYAAKFLDIVELTKARKQLKAKYGKQFFEDHLSKLNQQNNGDYDVYSIAPTGGTIVVNDRIVSKLNIQENLDPFFVASYLENICEQFEVDWKPVHQPAVDQKMLVPLPVGYSDNNDDDGYDGFEGKGGHQEMIMPIATTIIY